MSDKAVYRTAPATPGLLNILTIESQEKWTVHDGQLIKIEIGLKSFCNVEHNVFFCFVFFLYPEQTCKGK